MLSCRNALDLHPDFMSALLKCENNFLSKLLCRALQPNGLSVLFSFVLVTDTAAPQRYVRILEMGTCVGLANAVVLDMFGQDRAVLDYQLNNDLLTALSLSASRRRTTDSKLCIQTWKYACQVGQVVSIGLQSYIAIHMNQISIHSFLINDNKVRLLLEPLMQRPRRMQSGVQDLSNATHAVLTLDEQFVLLNCLEPRWTDAARNQCRYRSSMKHHWLCSRRHHDLGQLQSTPSIRFGQNLNPRNGNKSNLSDLKRSHVMSFEVQLMKSGFARVLEWGDIKVIVWNSINDDTGKMTRCPHKAVPIFNSFTIDKHRNALHK
jgi:hypothetical protein